MGERKRVRRLLVGGWGWGVGRCFVVLFERYTVCVFDVVVVIIIRSIIIL